MHLAALLVHTDTGIMHVRGAIEKQAPWQRNVTFWRREDLPNMSACCVGRCEPETFL